MNTTRKILFLMVIVILVSNTVSSNRLFIEFNPNDSDQALLATELGVWSTDNLDGGSTVWGASNTGFAAVCQH